VKKTGPLIAALTGVLALAAIGGTVFAQTAEEEGQSKREGFAGRVAAILGLETETVQSAMTRAHAELREERIQAHIQRLVDGGRLTPEQAEEYLEWFEARPDWAGPGFGPMMMAPKRYGHGGVELHGAPQMRFHFHRVPNRGEALSSTPTPSGTAL
jgi:hypothetical protein